MAAKIQITDSSVTPCYVFETCGLDMTNPARPQFAPIWESNHLVVTAHTEFGKTQLLEIAVTNDAFQKSSNLIILTQKTDSDGGHIVYAIAGDASISHSMMPKLTPAPHLILHSDLKIIARTDDSTLQQTQNYKGAEKKLFNFLTSNRYSFIGTAPLWLRLAIRLVFLGQLPLVEATPTAWETRPLEDFMGSSLTQDEMRNPLPFYALDAEPGIDDPNKKPRVKILSEPRDMDISANDFFDHQYDPPMVQLNRAYDASRAKQFPNTGKTWITDADNFFPANMVIGNAIPASNMPKEVGLPKLPNNMMWALCVNGLYYVYIRDQGQVEIYDPSVIAQYLNEATDPKWKDFLEAQALRLETIARATRIVSTLIQPKQPE